MVVCVFVLLAVVSSSFVCILIRCGKRGGREPVQTHGNTRLEILWTSVLIFLVFC